MEYLKALVGMLGGIVVFMFLLPLIPTAIERLSNKPNRYKKDGDFPVSSFGFFTSLEPGEVKLVEADNHFVRCIMQFNGRTFKGEADETLRKNSKEYWEVVSTTEGTYIGRVDSHPVECPGLHVSSLWLLPLHVLSLSLWLFPLYVWELWVYKITGYVFVGLYPFRRVRTYPFERLKSEIQPNGMVEFTKAKDFSDHFRVKDFQFSVRVPEADTSDKVPVSIQVDAMTRIFNPYAAAYETDDWAKRTATAIADCVTSYTRPLPLDSVLSAGKDDDGNDLARKIKDIGRIGGDQTDTTTGYGLTISQVLISDISVVEPSTDMKKKLADLAIARVESAAKAERAKGDASQLEEQIEVVRKGGHVGLAVLASERDVRTAGAAGDGAIVVVGGRNTDDPLQAAMLQELRSMNKEK